MSYQTSPYSGARSHAESSAAAERQRQQELEGELEAVRQQLNAARARVAGGTPGVSISTPGSYFGDRSAPIQSSYSALSAGIGSAPSSRGGGEPGIDAYYCERLNKLLGEKLDMHNLLAAPGVSIDEAFGAVLAAPAGSGKVPWIVTEDHWCDSALALCVLLLPWLRLCFPCGRSGRMT